jgi:predicted AAA+ superfamily ATPase
MDGHFEDILGAKLADALTADVPALTRREVRLPRVAGKALSVIGMRRSGKSCFLWQCLADLLAAGTPREALVLLNLEDDRLAGMDASALTWLLEEYYRLHPALRDRREVVFFLDEVQQVAGWEAFVRRAMDSEKMRFFLSGSSAAMLSREVATSMRGRAMEVPVYPFSFREFLAHHGSLPDREWERLPKATRSELEARLREYLSVGGFPEAQRIEERDRRALLQGYVDVVILRDVIERHQVSNPVALRWLQRHLMANAAGVFSIQKFHDSLKSQGIPVAKDSLHAFLGHLEDAFLIHTTSLLSASERQRMVNPRKAYPIDPGLIPIYERTGRANLGRALETAVLIELLRRGCDVHHVRVPDAGEIDFHATDAQGGSMLVQVCASAAREVVRDRELRPLDAARSSFRGTRRVLVLLDVAAPLPPPPAGVEIVPAVQWFLDTPH